MGGGAQEQVGGCAVRILHGWGHIFSGKVLCVWLNYIYILQLAVSFRIKLNEIFLLMLGLFPHFEQLFVS